MRISIYEVRQRHASARSSRSPKRLQCPVTGALRSSEIETPSAGACPLRTLVRVIEKTAFESSGRSVSLGVSLPLAFLGETPSSSQPASVRTGFSVRSLTNTS